MVAGTNGTKVGGGHGLGGLNNLMELIHLQVIRGQEHEKVFL